MSARARNGRLCLVHAKPCVRPPLRTPLQFTAQEEAWASQNASSCCWSRGMLASHRTARSRCRQLRCCKLCGSSCADNKCQCHCDSCSRRKGLRSQELPAARSCPAGREKGPQPRAEGCACAPRGAQGKGLHRAVTLTRVSRGAARAALRT